MSINVSKTGFGSIIGPSRGINLSKSGMGAIVGSGAGIVVSKVGMGVIIDTLHLPSTEPLNLMQFIP